jgi:hypothetical protein
MDISVECSEKFKLLFCPNYRGKLLFYFRKNTRAAATLHSNNLDKGEKKGLRAAPQFAVSCYFWFRYHFIAEGCFFFYCRIKKSFISRSLFIFCVNTGRGGGVDIKCTSSDESKF